MSVDTQAATQDKETRRRGDKEIGRRNGLLHSLSPRLLVSLSRLWYSTLWSACWPISLVWFRYRYTGGHHVPKAGPVLLVANHQSHLDPVLVGLACPRQLKYLARHDLFFWPFSWWIRALGAVPIDRKRGALGGIKTTLKLLDQREAVLVFPEGSRTPDGRLHPLLPGFCLLARRSGATVVPLAISGAYDAMPRGSVFPRPCSISLAFAPRIDCTEYQRLSDEQLTQLVESRITHLLKHGTRGAKPNSSLRPH
jgi:1-acyl-sn-glycerol-3-phosphate acyltransferase